ncbi:MAG: hypothetical protein K6B74_11960 [Ruminococcus sp.]|nr:hypothetical protein [Ruminococcus sp.]
MKLFKRFALIMLIIGTLFIMCSCKDSPEQIERNKEIVAAAKESAAVYILEKYGFEAEITDAVQEREYGMFGSSPLSTVFVRMRYGGKDFGVYVDNICYDNYQAEEIDAAVRADIEAAFPGLYKLRIKASEVDSVYDDFEAECVHMFHNYFDGTNAPEILLKGDRCLVTAYYVKTDLSSLEGTHAFDRYVSTYKGKMTFLSCRSEAKTAFAPEYDFDGSINVENAFFIDSSYILNSEGGEFRSYQLAVYDDIFTYTTSDNNTEGVYIKEVPADPSKLRKTETYKPDFMSPAFSISADRECTVRVFYPTYKITDYEHLKTFCVVYEKEADRFVAFTDDHFKYPSYDSTDFKNYQSVVALEIKLKPGEETTFAFVKDVYDKRKKSRLI